MSKKNKNVEEMKENRLRSAYNKVFNDLTAKGNSGLFVGKYDADNGSEEYMYGINTIMEVIAYRAGGDDCLSKFSEEFMGNMIESENLSATKGNHTKKERTKVYARRSALIGATVGVLAGCFFLLKGKKNG